MTHKGDVYLFVVVRQTNTPPYTLKKNDGFIARFVGPMRTHAPSMKPDPLFMVFASETTATPTYVAFVFVRDWGHSSTVKKQGCSPAQGDEQLI